MHDLFKHLAEFAKHAFKKETGTFVAGSGMGWLLSMRLLLAHVGVWDFLNAEFLVKTISGLAIAVVTGFGTVAGKDFYHYIKTKKQNARRKQNNKRRA